MICNGTRLGRLQLLAITCVLIAVKMEEVDWCDDPVGECVYLTGDAYDVEDVYDLEVKVLNTLDYRLSASTTAAFLSLIAGSCQLAPQVAFIASFACCIAASAEKLVQSRPSLIVSAAIAIAIDTMGSEPCWNKSLEFYSGYDSTSAELRACVNTLHEHFVESMSGHARDSPVSAVRARFSARRFRASGLDLRSLAQPASIPPRIPPT
jgi:Cyclin, C-terminal domain/Cyclin, N-terminal domain